MFFSFSSILILFHFFTIIFFLHFLIFFSTFHYLFFMLSYFLPSFSYFPSSFLPFFVETRKYMSYIKMCITFHSYFLIFCIIILFIFSSIFSSSTFTFLHSFIIFSTLPLNLFSFSTFSYSLFYSFKLSFYFALNIFHFTSGIIKR